MDKLLEDCISNTLGKEKERKDTQDRRENTQDEFEQVEGGYREEDRGEEGYRKIKAM